MAWRYLLGLLIGIVACGILLDQANIVPDLYIGAVLLTWWPLVIVVLSVNYLVRRPENAWGTLVLIGLGLFLLVERLGLVLDNVWLFTAAVVLLLFGVRLLLPRSRPPAAVGKTGISALFRPSMTDFVIFGGTQARNESQQFQGGAVTVFMGDYELDLREAVLGLQGAELQVRALFGSVILRIPPEMSYKIDGAPFLGVMENRARTIVLDEPGRPILRVRVNAVLSAMAVTN